MCMKGGTRKRGKTWSYYFDAATIDGKRKKKEKGGFRTKKEAETALAQALSEYNHSGLTFEPSSISVSDYLDYWMNEHCRMNYTENTLETYDSLICNHLKPQFGSYYLKSLQSATIQSYINHLKSKGYSKSSIQVIFAILSSALNYAVEPLHYIADNPCRFVRIGNVPKQKRQRIILSNDAFQRIIERFPFGTRYHIPLLIGWNFGLRMNECVALTWDDIDFENQTLSVNRQAVRCHIENKAGWALKEPKYNSKREIKFGESICKILKAEKMRQWENELKYGAYYTIYQLTDYIDEKGTKRNALYGTQKCHCVGQDRFPLICVDENGQLTTRDTFLYCRKVIHAELGIDFDYHSLRHTHATKLIEAGANIKAVQQRLGHKNIATTLDTYVHHTDDMAQEAADIFETAINSVLPPV